MAEIFRYHLNSPFLDKNRLLCRMRNQIRKLETGEVLRLWFEFDLMARQNFSEPSSTLVVYTGLVNPFVFIL